MFQYWLIINGDDNVHKVMMKVLVGLGRSNDGGWLCVVGAGRPSNTNVHISALNCYNRLFRKFTAHYC